LCYFGEILKNIKEGGRLIRGRGRSGRGKVLKLIYEENKGG